MPAAARSSPTTWKTPSRHSSARSRSARSGGEVGRIQRFSDAEDRYIVHLLGTLPHRLDGLKVVLDCAHGAASGCSPQVFKDAGAEVILIGAEPDGLNINDGVGSTHLGPLKQAVLAHGADLGIAHDGDADRCLAVDHEGSEVDGDEIMAILAVALKASGKLKDDVLVATVMSNLGLKIALREAGISLRETGVGDRYVLEGMREGGFNLGGEQSGHVIFADHATTGDGVLTGLQIAAQVALTGRPLKDLATVMTKLPAGPDQRQGRGPHPGQGRRRRGSGRSRSPRPSSATPAACSCAPPAPNRWCASWWRQHRRRPPRPSRNAWRRWSGPSWHWNSSRTELARTLAQHLADTTMARPPVGTRHCCVRCC